MEIENTLAYKDTATITAVKCFIVHALGTHCPNVVLSTLEVSAHRAILLEATSSQNLCAN